MGARLNVRTLWCALLIGCAAAFNHPQRPPLKGIETPHFQDPMDLKQWRPAIRNDRAPMWLGGLALPLLLHADPADASTIDSASEMMLNDPQQFQPVSIALLM